MSPEYNKWKTHGLTRVRIGGWFVCLFFGNEIGMGIQRLRALEKKTLSRAIRWMLSGDWTNRSAFTPPVPEVVGQEKVSRKQFVVSFPHPLQKGLDLLTQWRSQTG